MSETVPNWIMAVTTALAFGAAMWAGFTARRLYGVESERDRDRERAEERRQADLIAGWVSWSSQPRVALKLPSGRTSPASLALQNGSPVPVYDVKVTYSEGPIELGTQRFHVLSPTGTIAHYREIKCSGLADRLDEPREPDARLDLRVSLTFTDARGVRWTRATTGQLTGETA